VLWWLYYPAGSLGDHHRADHRQVVSVIVERDPRRFRPRVGLGGRDKAAGSSSAMTISLRATILPGLVVKMGTDWGALGFAAQSRRLQRQHAGDLLVIVDEPGGVASRSGRPFTAWPPRAWWWPATRSVTTATSASSMTAL